MHFIKKTIKKIIRIFDKNFEYFYHLRKNIKFINNYKPIIYVSHDACFNGAQLLSINIVKVLEEVFHYNVNLILIGDGVLREKFENIATNVICLEDYKENKNKIIKRFAKITKSNKAMCNTVISGKVLECLSKCNVSCISMIHEMENVITEYSAQDKLLSINKFAQKIVFASDYVRQSANNIHTIPDNKLVIRPQGIYKRNLYYNNDNVSKEIKNELNIPIDSKIVLGVGYADRRKGIDLFVDCAKKVTSTDKNVYFVWVGPIDSRFDISNNMKDMDESKIIFTGPKDDPMKYYAASDCYLLTSREDPFPTVVMEAMDAGLPVIAFNNGGGYVDIINDKTGSLVDMENTDQMSDAIVKWLNKNSIDRDYIYNYVNSKFSFVNYVYDLLDLLGEKYNKVSVIVPNYNYAKYLSDRLDSIINQDYPLLEVIVIDDCSTDNSKDIIKDYEMKYPLLVRGVYNPQNSGNVFKQWNKGFELAKGDYVWIAEADDLSKSNFVSSLINKFNLDQNVVMAYSQSFMMNENGDVTAPNYLSYTNDVDENIYLNDYIIDSETEVSKHLSIKNTIPNVSAVIFKNNDYSYYLDSATKYHVAGDWSFYYNILTNKNNKIAFVSQSLNYHRRHDDSVTSELNNSIHFDEICSMQETIYNKFKQMVPYDKVLNYREEVKKYLEL